MPTLQFTPETVSDWNVWLDTVLGRRSPSNGSNHSRTEDGRLVYRFKRPWRDGTTHVVFDPLELLEKLAALVPAPKAHLVRYYVEY